MSSESDGVGRCVEPQGLLVAEDGASAYGRAAVARLVVGAEPLHNDYAPVDQLETR
jgi:hypothetical protein